jgi:hypothetical protein
MKQKYDVTFTISVELEIDKSKFDEAFMKEFREGFYDFDTLDEHVAHLAQLYLRGINDDRDFIEGYGEAEEMGIKFLDYTFVDEDVEEVENDT